MPLSCELLTGRVLLSLALRSVLVSGLLLSASLLLRVLFLGAQGHSPYTAVSAGSPQQEQRHSHLYGRACLSWEGTSGC